MNNQWFDKRNNVIFKNVIFKNTIRTVFEIATYKNYAAVVMFENWFKREFDIDDCASTKTSLTFTTFVFVYMRLNDFMRFTDADFSNWSVCQVIGARKSTTSFYLRLKWILNRHRIVIIKKLLPAGNRGILSRTKRYGL